jgi:hypothetical protein
MATEKTTLPFFTGKGPVSHDTFAGRHDLRKLIENLTWGRVSNERQDHILIVEGRSSFGKSSLARWCRDEVKKKAADGEIILCMLELREDDDPYNEAKEKFYKYLFDETYKSFAATGKKRMARWKRKQIERQAKKALTWFSELDLGSWNLLKGLKPKPLSSEKLFKFMQALDKCAQTKPKAYLFIVDDVSIHSRGPQLCTELLMALNKYSEEEKWPKDFPNVMLILLPLPGWREQQTGAGKTVKEIGARRRVDEYTELLSFNMLEIEEFVRRRCIETGWTYNEKTFIPALYYLSGGIPRLLQRIGVEACVACLARGSRDLKDEDILDALRSEKLNSDIEDVIQSALNFDTQKYLDTPEDRDMLPLFYRLETIEGIDWGGKIPPVLKGITREEWRKRTMALIGSSNKNQKAFDKLWDAFAKHGILVYEDGRYRFSAEAIRRYFNQFNPK